MRSRILAIVLVAAGTLFTLFVVFFKQKGNSADYVSSIVQIAGPWLVADVLVIWLRWYRGIALAAAPMLLLELYIYYGVFINPQSSTDAVAYVFKPGVQLLVFLPIGLLIGRAIDKSKQSRSGRSKGPGSN